MNKKKVLIVATTQCHIAHFHKPLAESLKNNGFEIHVAGCDNLSDRSGLKIDFADKIFNIPFSRSPFSFNNFKALKQLKRIIKEEKYDIVHCNTHVAGILARIASKKFRKKGLKVIYTAHGFYFYKGSPKKNWLLWYKAEKYCSKFTDAIITINHEDYALAKEKFKCPVFYTHGVGVNINRFSPVSTEEKERLRVNLGIELNKFVVLCVGEVNKNKNQITAIKAVRELKERIPNVLLLVVGNGCEVDNLKKYVVENDLEDNVNLLGYKTNVEEYQRVADVVVSCSKREGLPINIVEAMLSQNPVVVSNNRGHKDLVKSGENGFLFDFGNFKQLGDCIFELFNDKSKREEFVRKSFSVVQDYTESNVLKELKCVYEKIL